VKCDDYDNYDFVYVEHVCVQELRGDDQYDLELLHQLLHLLLLLHAGLALLPHQVNQHFQHFQLFLIFLNT
jgi:hypothetical protein